MESLKELVSIVNRNKIKQIDILDFSDLANFTKVNQLYQAISSSAVKSDKDAFQLLYERQDSIAAYNNVKRVLKEKLINIIFFIDGTSHEEDTDRQIAFFQLQRDFAAAQHLLAKNATVPAIKLLESILTSAQEYEFTDLCTFICRHLYLYYATNTGDKKEYTNFYNLWKKYRNLYTWESKAEFYYSELVIRYGDNKTTKADLQQLASAFYRELSEKVPEIDSYTYHFFIDLIHLFSDTCTPDHIGTFSKAEQVLRFY